VLEFLRTEGFDEVLDGNTIGCSLRISAKPPWNGAGAASRRPDIAFRGSSGWTVADAKYKLLAGDLPDVADLNQLFVYATLSHVDLQRPVAVHLFFPTPGPTRQLKSMACAIAGHASLVISAVHFPSIAEVLRGLRLPAGTP
jgi:hypothetical protein